MASANGKAPLLTFASAYPLKQSRCHIGTASSPPCGPVELPSPRANPFILQPILSYSTFGVARQLPQNGQQARRTHLPFRPFSCKQMFHVKHFGIRRDAKPRANEAPGANKALRRASCARTKRSAEQGVRQNKAPNEAKHPKREGLPAERETERGQSVRSDRAPGKSEARGHDAA